MAIDVSALTDYAWSDIAIAAKHAMITAAMGGGELRMSDGRMIKRLTIDEAKALYALATESAAAEAAGESGGGIVLVRRGSAV